MGGQGGSGGRTRPGTNAVPALVCAVALAVAVPATAQPSAPRWQVSVSGVWNGSSSLGSQAATETPNQTGASRYTLFKTETEMHGGFGAEARLTYWATRIIGAELGASWARPQLVTSISSDAEGAPNTTARSDVTTYAIDGSVVLRLTRLAFAGGRIVPQATAGVGYLRQLYDGRVLIETGTVYRAGGGVLCWLQPVHDGWIRRAGLRADVLWTRHHDGVALGDSQARSFVAVTAGVALQF